MSGRSLAVIVLVAAACACVAAEEGFLHHSVAASLVAADRDAAADRIAAWVERAGGWFVLKSGERVVARVPNAALQPLRELLERIAEEGLEFTPGAVDLREPILAAQAALRSREEILGRNLAFLDRADAAGTLAIEREVSTLMQEIEGLKGRLRKLETDRAYARAEVRLAHLEQRLPQKLPSSFPWINGVDFYGFVKGAFR